MRHATPRKREYTYKKIGYFQRETLIYFQPVESADKAIGIHRSWLLDTNIQLTYYRKNERDFYDDLDIVFEL